MKFYQSYSEADIEDLTKKARTLWEYDFQSEPKRILRKPNVVTDTVPLRAIYRMAVEDWKDKHNNYYFPFANGNYKNIIGLRKGWDIPLNDRKFIEKDMMLMAADKTNVLILPEKPREWWETTWFNILSIFMGVTGIAVSIFSYFKT